MTPVDRETGSPSGWLRWVAMVLALAALYVVMARLGLMLALPPEKKATAVWPPSGIALAAVLLYGHRVWPGVWLGSFVANFWDGVTLANLFVSAGIATGSTLQALAGNVLIRRWVGVHPFQRAAQAFMFTGLVIFVCLIAATFGVASLYLGGFAPAKALSFIWWTWWLGDLTGMLTVGSLLLAWSRGAMLDWSPRRLAEAALLLLLVLILGSVIFGIVSPITDLPVPLAYLVIPFLVWATFRYGLQGATTSLVLVSALAVAGTAQGHGPFAQPTVGSSLLLLQVFMTVVSITILVMAAVLTERTEAETALRDSEVRFTTLAAAVPGFLFTNQAEGRSDYISRRFYEYTGLADGEVDGQGWIEVVHPDEREGVAAHFGACLNEQKMFERKCRFLAADGRYRWFFIRSIPFLNEQRQAVKWHGICIDIDDQVRAENALRELTHYLEQRTQILQESEERFRSAFDCAPIGLALAALDGKWLRVNHSLCEILGYSEAEFLARDFRAITHPEDLEIGLDQVRQLITGHIRTYQIEKRYLHKDGHSVSVLLSTSLVHDSNGQPLYFIKQIQDISQQKQAEAEIKTSLHEKEVLLKEIHHRVKNNLQIVSALLELQSAYMGDEQGVAMFKESRDRVRSMALIHEQLYHSRELAQVNVAAYIRQLADDLYRTYKVSSEQILLDVVVLVQPLTVDRAIPCGLLLNELLSNCLKHAFKNVAQGSIRVTLARSEADRTILTVADDGVGFPSGLDFHHTQSFGMQLVCTLVEQLRGEILLTNNRLTNNRGTVFTITFPAT